MKIGIGYDIHRFEENLKLVLGGVYIPYKKGLKGHSDADVLTHSICDALIGAAGLGDIGEHFPDNDKKYKNINSLKLLEYSYQMISNLGLFVSNIDITILAEEPSLNKYKNEIRKNISEIINNKNINVKATTTETLGFIGNKDGIASICVVLLNQK